MFPATAAKLQQTVGLQRSHSSECERSPPQDAGPLRALGGEEAALSPKASLKDLGGDQELGSWESWGLCKA